MIYHMMTTWGQEIAKKERKTMLAVKHSLRHLRKETPVSPIARTYRLWVLPSRTKLRKSNLPTLIIIKSTRSASLQLIPPPLYARAASLSATARAATHISYLPSTSAGVFVCKDSACSPALNSSPSSCSQAKDLNTVS